MTVKGKQTNHSHRKRGEILYLVGFLEERERDKGTGGLSEKMVLDSRPPTEEILGSVQVAQGQQNGHSLPLQ